MSTYRSTSVRSTEYFRMVQQPPAAHCTCTRCLCDATHFAQSTSTPYPRSWALSGVGCAAAAAARDSRVLFSGTSNQLGTRSSGSSSAKGEKILASSIAWGLGYHQGGNRILYVLPYWYVRTVCAVFAPTRPRRLTAFLLGAKAATSPLGLEIDTLNHSNSKRSYSLQ